MNLLLPELIQLIFINIPKISDKRFFIRTCKIYNLLLQGILTTADSNFITDGFDKITKYCKEKFTLELCYDKYFHLLPESYINSNNEVLIRAVLMYGNSKILAYIMNDGSRFDMRLSY